MTATFRASAVRQNHVEPADSLDDFPTPPWATRALCEWLKSQRYPLHMLSAHDPAANRGYMVRGLRDYFRDTTGADIHDYGAGFPQVDFLARAPIDPGADWIITNPPFKNADKFARYAIAGAWIGAAMFVRTAFLEGAKRHAALFDGPTRPTAVLQFAERVVIHRAAMLDPDIPVPTVTAAGATALRRPSTATAYCWVIWTRGGTKGPTRLNWIPPSRKRLTRAGDYAPPAPIPTPVQAAP